MSAIMQTDGTRAVSGCLRTDLYAGLSARFLPALFHSSVRSTYTSWKHKGTGGAIKSLPRNQM